MIGHKIIIEGIDGAGKDTYIKHILATCPDMNYKVIHCTRQTPNTYKYFRDLLLSEDNIIFNRFIYGQFVYQTKQMRKDRAQLDLWQLVKLEELILDINAEVIWVQADIQTCLYNCKQDSEDNYYTEEYLRDLHNKFKQVFDMSLINVRTYYNDYHPYKIDNGETIDYKAFDYDSLPKVVAVDFDGTLVLGAKFPEIGELNTKLVHLLNTKYKDYKKILFTHRSGPALIDACTFCADHGIYFDAVNDDIPEIKDALRRNAIDHRKIWFDVLFDDKANPDEFI